MTIQRVTIPTLLVLQEITRRPTEECYAYGLARATGLAAGTVQRVLTRLEESGILDAEWEDIDPIAEGRPAQRRYRISDQHAQEAWTLLSRGRERLDRVGAWRPAPGWHTQ